MKSPLDIATNLGSAVKDMSTVGVSTNYTYSGTVNGNAMDDSRTWD